MQSEIKQIVDSLQRFREASLEQKFTDIQKKYIKTFSGISFKEQMFRSIGLGKCQTCGQDTPYAEKMRFNVYCSNECGVSHTNKIKQEQRLIDITTSLSLINMTLIDPENYINALSSIHFKCNKCNTNLKTQIGRALLHICKETTTVPKVPKIRKKKPAIKKISKTNNCLTCNIPRNKKAKPGLCMSCHIKAKHIKVSNDNLFKLNDLGYTTKEVILWDNHKKYEITNQECGHTFNVILGNILSRTSICPICGPIKRTENMMLRYMKKYARTYDMNIFKEYTKYVRYLSDINWEEANPEDICRGHASYHLDHKVPIIFGFKNNIPPEAIADIDNLEILSYQDNLTKGGKMYRYDILEILKQKYNFAKYIPGLQRALTAKTEQLLSYIRIEPSLVMDNYVVYGNTTLLVVNFNTQQSMGDLIREITNNYLIVYEDELLDNRRRIIESMINYSKGTARKIYARKCKIQEISANQSDRFMLGGSIKATIKLGMFYEDELVAVMLFCKSRWEKKYEWELLRFANKLDTSVIGGVSKLFSYFIIHYLPNSIMTYSDKRFGNNKTVYETIGMFPLKVTTPATWWVKDGKRISSQDTRPEKMAKLLGNDFDPTIGTETNMERNGWIKIEDLGSNVYGWVKPTE